MGWAVYGTIVTFIRNFEGARENVCNETLFPTQLPTAWGDTWLRTDPDRQKQIVWMDSRGSWGKDERFSESSVTSKRGKFKDFDFIKKIQFLNFLQFIKFCTSCCKLQLCNPIKQIAGRDMMVWWRERFLIISKVFIATVQTTTWMKNLLWSLVDVPEILRFHWSEMTREVIKTQYFSTRLRTQNKATKYVSKLLKIFFNSHLKSPSRNIKRPPKSRSDKAICERRASDNNAKMLF